MGASTGGETGRREFDAIVVGAGLAGLVAACEIAGLLNTGPGGLPRQPLQPCCGSRSPGPRGQSPVGRASGSSMVEKSRSP